MRDLKVSVLSLAILPALFVGAATAQVVDPTAFQPRNDAGLGSIKRSFNATQLTNVPGISCNGEPKACALTSAIWHKGRFWVFGREGWCCAQGVDTWVFEWTGDGTYIASSRSRSSTRAVGHMSHGIRDCLTRPDHCGGFCVGTFAQRGATGRITK